MNHDDRPKRSWSEIDRMRDGARRREERGPRGEAAQARARGATEQYLKKLDATVFATGKRGGAGGDALGKTLLEARGSGDFDDHCRSYLDAVGVPTDLGILSALLDARDNAIRVAALDALAVQIDAGASPERGLSNQVRALADDFDDALAEAAEDVLAKLSP